MSNDHQLSDLQLAMMRVLWDRGEATAAQVHAALLAQDRALAPTTVATVLSRLEKRGLIEHRTSGRQYIYYSTISEQDVRSSMVQRVTDFFFGGDTGALLSHLVRGRDVGARDLETIRALIARKQTEHAAEDDG